MSQANRAYELKVCGESVPSLIYTDDKDWESQIKPKAGARILTYNVHGFRDVKRQNSLEEILYIIKKIDADIIIIEEFVLHGSKTLIEFDDFLIFLKSIGYAVFWSDAKHYNVMGTKLPLQSLQNSYVWYLGTDPGHNCPRYAMGADIDIGYGSRPLRVIGTHLDVYDETGSIRVKQIKEILRNAESHQRVIIAGDLNCLRPEDYDETELQHIIKADQMRRVQTIKTDAVQILEEAGYVEASVQTGNPIKTSVWANRRCDYICGLGVKFAQSGVVRNASSDHYAYYADIDRSAYYANSD